MTGLLLACRRSRRLYAAVVIAVIFSMVVVPLMQSERALAFFERQTERQAELADIQQAQHAGQEAWAERATSSWDPHRDPLAQSASAETVNVGRRDAATAPRDSASVRLATSAAAPQVTPTPTPPPASECDASDTDDGDNDGLTDYQECLSETDPTDPDFDGDGLSDGQEVNRLATDPAAWDTDGDAITDTLEVQGLYYAGQRWYLDPKNADSNSDGLLDSLDCPPLVEGVTDSRRIADECDTDGDEIIDLFDADNDNDGVPDREDISPRQVVDRAGVHSTADDVRQANVFTDKDPFTLMVQGLETGMPAFVDLQLRPDDPDHLSYMRNVLDWPEDDLDGQIQHVKPTTFQDSDNPDIANPDDEAGGHGDMRLVPLLEIEMSGSSIPLKWIAPVVTATVESSTAFSATVVLTQQSASDPAKYDTALHFTFQDGASHKVEIYHGSCEALDTVAKTFTSVANKSSVIYNDMLLAELADGQHAVVFPDVASSSPPLQSGEGSGVGACANIPGVVPMPHYDDKIVDLSVLEPYGISVKQATADTAGGLRAAEPGHRRHRRRQGGFLGAHAILAG